MQDENPLAFPKKADKARLEKYLFYDKLYESNHFDAFQIRGEKSFSAHYARLRYINANFAGLISRVMADMLFGENLVIDVEDSRNQDFIDGLKESNHLVTQLYESELVNSRKGDDVFIIRVGQRNTAVIDSEAEIIIEQLGPEYYFPQFDNKSAKYVVNQDVIAHEFKEGGKWYIHKEIHTPGTIINEVYSYDKDQQKTISPENPAKFGYKEQEETGVKRSLVFHIPNVRDGSIFWGTSDYRDLITLFFAINNRLTKTDNILDKHSDPILAVPSGVLDENGNINKSAIGMFEMDNETGQKPEYIVWNANLEAAEKQLDRLTELLMIVAEMAPDSLGLDNKNGGVAESGRALKFKLLATIRKRNRKKIYYDQAIKDMLTVCQELSAVHGITINGKRISEPERPTIDWGTGIMRDETEEITNEIQRIDAGISTRADAIARLDNKTPDEAQKKVEEIDKERDPQVPTVVTRITPQPPNPNQGS